MLKLILTFMLELKKNRKDVVPWLIFQEYGADTHVDVSFNYDS